MAKQRKKIKYGLRNKYELEEDDSRKYFLRLLRETLKIIPSNFDYFLMYGTLIGFCRERNILAWDTDVDIYMDDSHREDIIKIMKKNWGVQGEFAGSVRRILDSKGLLSLNMNMTRKECRELRRRQKKRHKQTPAAYAGYISCKPYLDIYFYKHYDKDRFPDRHSGETIRARHNAGCPAIPTELVFPIKNEVMQGIKVKAPNKPEEILSLVYGNWEVPVHLGGENASRYQKAVRYNWKVSW
jgi:hypothetical protein